MNSKERLVSPLVTPGREKPPLEKLVLTTTTEKFSDWVTRWSQTDYLWPFPIGTACCASEYWMIHSPRLSTGKQGISPDRHLPSESDLMIVAGTITEKILPYIKEAYDQMMPEKWVLAVGACAGSGGPFNSYSVVQGISRDIPVDVYIPGCPPSPESIVDAVSLIRERVSLGVMASRGVPLKEVHR